MSAQVAAIMKKFTTQTWILRHLNHRGFSQEDLLKVYRPNVLPVQDYCSTVYNLLLTLTQANALEGIQANALKAIYGCQYWYRLLLETSGLKNLHQRRDRRSDNFARKCLTIQKFSGWFPRNEPARLTRSPLHLDEFRARTNRLYDLPVYHMRRRRNVKSCQLDLN